MFLTHIIVLYEKQSERYEKECKEEGGSDGGMWLIVWVSGERMGEDGRMERDNEV